MDINDRIRKQVLADLRTGLIDEKGQSLIALFVNGLPGELALSDPSYPEQGSDIPALSVALSDGQCIEADLNAITWQAMLSIKIFLEASNFTDPELDILGEKVRMIIGATYTAAGLLNNCNRSSFDYGRDEQQPWGILELNYAIEYEE